MAGGGGESEESRSRSRGISRIAPARDAHGASVDALPDAGVARAAECDVGARERDRNPPRRIIREADFSPSSEWGRCLSLFAHIKMRSFDVNLERRSNCVTLQDLSAAMPFRIL